MAAKILRRPHVCLAAKQLTQFLLHSGHIKERWNMLRMVFKEHIHVTGRPESVGKDRAE